MVFEINSYLRNDGVYFIFSYGNVLVLFENCP